MDYLLLIGLSVPWCLLAFLKISHNKLKNKLAEKEQDIESLLKKYELNPSYDCQLFMASLMSQDALYKIEAIDASNIFIRRKS